MIYLPPRPKIPECSWKRPIGLGWDNPYTVRYASNLDDGPWHGMPLGGFGAGCIGRSSRGDFNLWHLDGGEHTHRSLPACQFSVFEQPENAPKQAYALCTEPPEDGSLSSWQWYPGSEVRSQKSEVRSQEKGVRSQESEVRSQESGERRQKSGVRSQKSRERRKESEVRSQKSEVRRKASGAGGTTDDEQHRSTGTYHALYPRSWFTYENVFQTELTCEQFSPIWAGCYQESSYPVAVFEWTAHNPTDKPITLSIMLTWQNMVGWFTNAIPPQPVDALGGLSGVPVRVRDDGSPVYEYQPRWGESTGSYNQWIVDNFRVGCLLDRVRLHDEIQEGEGQLCFTTVTNPSLEVFYNTRWNPSGSGAQVWLPFAADGSLGDIQDETPASPGEQIAAAIAVRFTIRPGKTRKIPFILAWDFPVTEFAPGINYYRRYTDFFGRTGNNSWSIARTALKHTDLWKEKIQSWQEPILNREDLPNWFKMALFNELYLLADGGSLWTAASDKDPIGQFGVLECLDYRWYESLDVRLYGSFALALLWPRLDKAVLEAFARAIPTSDDTPRIIGYNKAEAIRKAADATPHDLGAPNEHPWERTNYTSYQDCNQWKDLPCDFVLQVYRDFVLTGANDTEFLWECWSAIEHTLAYLKTFDKDGDGIPENSGAPDQTFDDWRLQGISAYCGGLWLAALEAAIAIGEILINNYPPISELIVAPELESIPETLELYRQWLELSLPIYQEKLWNGQYYQLDSESGSDIVMADQLCGQFYAQLLKLPNIVPKECTESALKTVYDSCFLKFHNGQLGAANGVKPDGSPEKPDATHPLEVWTGINFGLAAFLIQQGMKEEGLRLAEIVVQQVYENGLQFRTPEAITAAGTFRASHYLRAMAIWGVYLMIN